jgi:outer membrane protein assembly factor BamB
LYALRARDGKLLWKRILCGNPDDPACESDAHDGTRIFSSPAVHDGLVFVGNTNDGQDGYRGAVFRRGTRRTAPSGGASRSIRSSTPAATSCSITAACPPADTTAAAATCGRPSAWTPTAIAYTLAPPIATTACCRPITARCSRCTRRTGRLQWVFRPIAEDTCDLDIGATANLIDRDRDRFLGFGSKSGHYHLIDRRTGLEVWDTQVVPGGNAGGFFGGAAVSGIRRGLGHFVRRSVRDPGLPVQSVPGAEPSRFRTSPRALGSGSTRGTRATPPRPRATVVVFVSYINLLGPPRSELHAYEAETGTLLFSTPVPVSLGPPTPARRGVFLGTGNIRDGSGGGISAYRLP